MAGFASVAEDIRTALRASWTAAFPAVPIHFDGDPRASTQPDAEDEFIRATITEARSAHIPDIGSRTAWVHGLVIVQVFTQAGLGDKRNRTLCDGVRNAFQGLRHGEARFQATDRDSRGVSEDGRHLQANVTTRFRFESTAT